MSLSIAGASSYLSQMLSRMFSGLDGPQNITSSTSSTSANSTAPVAATPAEPDAGNALTGSSQPILSDEVLALLVQSQSQTSVDASQTSLNSNETTTTTTTAANTSSGNNPIQLFAAMDGNGDGVVASMKKYIESQARTQSPIDTNNDGSISQDELNSFLASVQRQNPFGMDTSPITGSGPFASQSYNLMTNLLNTIDPSQALIA